MIPVGVREKKINVVSVFIGKLFPKPPNTGTGINSNDITALGADFQAGGIAAVF
jgi:hypothetical protein